MLSLSSPISSTIEQYLVLHNVTDLKTTEKPRRDIQLRLELAITKAVVDAFIVCGTAFFSSLIALGCDNPIVNLKLSLFAGFTMGGLAFFNEVNAQMKQ